MCNLCGFQVAIQGRSAMMSQVPYLHVFSVYGAIRIMFSSKLLVICEGRGRLAYSVSILPNFIETL